MEVGKSVDASVLKLAVAAGIVKLNREAIGALAKVRKHNFAQSPGNQDLRPLWLEVCSRSSSKVSSDTDVFVNNFKIVMGQYILDANV